MKSTIIGYILAGIGLLGVMMSSRKIKDSIPVIKALATKYILIVSLIIVAAGIVLLILAGRGSAKQAKEEVPIYEGKGKKRKIVGYQREK